MTETNTSAAAAPKAEHSAPGGAVVSTGCKRRSGKVVKLPCGCSSDDIVWLTLCSIAARNVADYRRRARDAHKAADEPLLK